VETAFAETGPVSVEQVGAPAIDGDLEDEPNLRPGLLRGARIDPRS
jgi:hypothetical protein